jgi:glycosyltransferase involved in cell wall biosynthesis
MATNTGGIPEMLGGHGVLAADCDVQSVADALEKAAVASSDRSTRNGISDYATSAYSGEAAAEQLVELWSSVTANGRRR